MCVQNFSFALSLSMKKNLNKKRQKNRITTTKHIFHILCVTRDLFRAAIFYYYISFCPFHSLNTSMSTRILAIESTLACEHIRSYTRKKFLSKIQVAKFYAHCFYLWLLCIVYHVWVRQPSNNILYVIGRNIVRFCSFFIHQLQWNVHSWFL